MTAASVAVFVKVQAERYPTYPKLRYGVLGCLEFLSNSRFHAADGAAALKK
jgi:hypothetical protein